MFLISFIVFVRFFKNCKQPFNFSLFVCLNTFSLLDNIVLCLYLSLSLQVKVLYVRNLMLGTTEGLIDEAFSTHAPVERVKKIKDYAFVHFTSKEDAHVSMDKMNGKII